MRGYNSTPSVIISTLPSSTINDLANLTVIPPFALSFAGERLWPRWSPWSRPAIPITGSMCSVTRSGVTPWGRSGSWTSATTNYQVVFGNPSGSPEADGVTYGNRWSMPTLSRDSSDTYSQLEVRGGPLITGIICRCFLRPTQQ